MYSMYNCTRYVEPKIRYCGIRRETKKKLMNEKFLRSSTKPEILTLTKKKEQKKEIIIHRKINHFHERLKAPFSFNIRYILFLFVSFRCASSSA